MAFLLRLGSPKARPSQLGRARSCMYTYGRTVWSSRPRRKSHYQPHSGQGAHHRRTPRTGRAEIRV